MKTFCLIVTLCIGFIVCDDSQQVKPPTIECLVNYLQSQQMGDEYFSSIDALVPDQKFTCDIAMKKKIADIYIDFYRNNKNKKTTTVSCAARDIEGRTYENLVMKAEVMDKVQTFWKFWNYYQKGNKLETLKNEAKDIEDRAFIKCVSSEDFGTIFDHFFEKNDRKKSDFDGETEYCLRDYLLNQKLINSESFGFVLNPRNVRTEVLDCTEKVKQTLDIGYNNKTLVPSTNDCQMKVYREMNFMDYILKGRLLSQLRLTNPDRQTEKQNFINTMIEIKYKIKNC
ncbi:unnamed protein product [Diamesa serratosioi]